MTARLGRWVPAVLLLAVACSAGPDKTTKQGQTFQDLWQPFLVIAGLVVLLIWGLVAWCVIRYRARPGDDGLPNQDGDKPRLELAYTLVPLILVAVLFTASSFLIGTLMFAVSVPSMLQELRLRSEGVVVYAEVTNWRVHHGRYGISHEVRYAFRRDGRAYTRSDPFPFGPCDLWSSIPDALWEQTKSTRALAVLHLPAAPESNRPARTPLVHNPRATADPQYAPQSNAPHTAFATAAPPSTAAAANRYPC